MEASAMQDPTPSPRAWLLLVCLAGTLLAAPDISWSHGTEPHGLQKGGLGGAPYQRSVSTYPVPDVVLTDYDERPIHLRELLAAADPVLLNFVFTTCRTVCPVTTKVLAEVPELLGREGRRLRLVSISIDPENDTPLQLKAYARSFQAGERWKFLTGRTQDIKQVQIAFGSYGSDKMNHVPVTLMRPPSSTQWIRIDGFATPAQLVQEYRKRVAQ
jgi:protein SCO1/2